MSDILSKIMAFELGELSFKDTVHLFAYLVKTYKIYTLQSIHGCSARSLIEQGYISEDGDVLEDQHNV
jgi:hypothetical protein